MGIFNRKIVYGESKKMRNKLTSVISKMGIFNILLSLFLAAFFGDLTGVSGLILNIIGETGTLVLVIGIIITMFISAIIIMILYACIPNNDIKENIEKLSSCKSHIIDEGLIISMQEVIEKLRSVDQRFYRIKIMPFIRTCEQYMPSIISDLEMYFKSYDESLILPLKDKFENFIGDLELAETEVNDYMNKTRCPLMDIYKD